MKESILNLKNLSLNGKKSDNEKETWKSPADRENEIIKRERKKLLLYLFISNISLVLFFNLSNQEVVAMNENVIVSNHSLIHINAKLHIPLNKSSKIEVSLFSQTGVHLTKGYILPKKDQSPINEFGPWKIEIPNHQLAKVIRFSQKIIKVVPIKTKEIINKRKISEIKF